MASGVRAVAASPFGNNSGWREESEEFFRPTNKNPSRTIQIEQEERDAADCRPRGDFVSVPLEMIPPVVQPWIEKRGGYASFGVQAFHTTRLRQIATRASPSQIIELRKSAFGAGN